MLLNEVELGRDKALKGLPVSGVFLSVLLAKAEEQVGRKCLVNGSPVILIADDTSLWNRFASYLVKAISPFVPVINSLLCVVHMSGLQGFFVWKQKSYHGCAGHPIHP